MDASRTSSLSTFPHKGGRTGSNGWAELTEFPTSAPEHNARAAVRPLRRTRSFKEEAMLRQSPFAGSVTQSQSRQAWRPIRQAFRSKRGTVDPGMTSMSSAPVEMLHIRKLPSTRALLQGRPA